MKNMTQHSLVKVVNPSSYMCGQQGIIWEIHRGQLLKYDVKIKGRIYKFASSDIAEVLLTVEDLKKCKVLGTLGELTRRG